MGLPVLLTTMLAFSSCLVWDLNGWLLSALLCTAMSAYCGCPSVTLGLHMHHLEGADHTAKKPTTAYVLISEFALSCLHYKREDWVANLGAMLFYTSSSTFLYICVPVSPVYLLVVMVHCAWACECQTGLKSILILQLKCLHTQCSPFLFAALRSERKQPRCTHWKQHGMEGVKTRGCCRFNEAIVRTTACFFQNSSQRCHLSPIEEMLWAMSVRGQERLPFILLYSWFRIKRG